MYKYFILLSSFAVLGATSLRAQNKETENDKVNWFQGVSIEADAASFISGSLNKENSYSMHGSIHLNLYNKYIPVIEGGFSGCEKTTDKGISFGTSAPFGRLGIDFNLLKGKKSSTISPNLFVVGLRLGGSKFSYNINNIQIDGGYWGSNEIINYPSINTLKLWFEISAGVQVDIIKKVYVGWRVRNKIPIGKNETGKPSPWFIPGFGINNDGSIWEFNYNIGYRF